MRFVGEDLGALPQTPRARFLWWKLLGRSFPPHPLQELLKKGSWKGGYGVFSDSSAVGGKMSFATDRRNGAPDSDQGPPRPCSLHES